MMKFKLRLVCTLIFALSASVHFARDSEGLTGASDTEQTEVVEFNISGTITDANGDPLIGVNIQEKENMQNGTVTDVEGNFSFDVTDGNSTLVFSYIGYESREVSINNRSRIEITLQESSSVLDEVVVVGYGTQLKRDVTGAVSTLKADELAKFNVSSLDQQIQGLAAGVQVTAASGVPGAPVRVLVRGTNSLFSGTEPLWIIDGMILSGQGGGEISGFSRNASTTPFNPLATINPNDIASIEVLKDAAATAVYGSRGANGVIIITTKSGQAGRGGLDLTVNYGTTDVVRGPEEMGFVDGQTWLALADEARLNQGLSEFDPNSILNNSRDPNAVLERSQIANTNWFDYVLRQGQVYDINLSTSLATDKINYYISTNYRKEESILTSDLQERISLRANVDFEPVKDLTIGTRLNVSYVDRERAPNGGSPGGNSNIARGGYNQANGAAVPILPVYHPTLRNPDGSPALFDPLSGNNLLATLDRNNYINDVETYRVLAGFQGEYKVPFIKGLSLRSEVAADLLQTNNIEWGNTVIREDSEYAFDFSSTFTRLNYNLYATLNRDLGRLHNINLVFGTESTEQFTRSRNIEAQELFNGIAKEVGTAGDAQRVSAGFGGEVYFRGYFGRLNYKLNNRYLLGLSYRHDGSSIFKEDLRWGDFMAVSAGWIVSDEAFMEDVEAIDMLKLRSSFGQTGNSAINPQATETTYATWGRYGDVGAGDLLNTIGNSAVTWETTNAYDAGVEVELYKGRVSANVGYYVQDVKDMLFQVPVPSSSGIFNNTPAIWKNIGDMRNRGWEVELSTINVNTADFSWKSGINFTTNQNEVVRLVSDDDQIYNVRNSPLVTQVGERIGFFKIARYAGIHSEGGYELIQEMDLEHFAATGETRPTGNLIPATRANLQQHLFDETDKSGLPTYFGGFSNSFSYKGLELFALISFSGGNYIYDRAAESGFLVAGAWQYRSDLVGNYWTSANRDAEYPALSWNRRYDVINDDGSVSANERFDNQRAGQVHDRFLQKGDYIRMRSLSLAYTLPQSLLQGMFIKNIRVAFTANNLFTITGYDGYDPEVADFGGERNLGQGWVGVQLPQVKSFNFNVNFSF